MKRKVKQVLPGALREAAGVRGERLDERPGGAAVHAALDGGAQAASAADRGDEPPVWAVEAGSGGDGGKLEANGTATGHAAQAEAAPARKES